MTNGGAGDRVDVPCQDSRRFAIAVERKKQRKRCPISTDSNKHIDLPRYSIDEWFWRQVEAKR